MSHKLRPDQTAKAGVLIQRAVASAYTHLKPRIVIELLRDEANADTAFGILRAGKETYTINADSSTGAESLGVLYANRMGFANFAAMQLSTKTATLTTSSTLAYNQD